MAKATTYSVSSTGGNREDLSDIIKMVEPEKYPIVSMIPDGGAPSSTLHEWLVDSLNDATFAGVIEGTDQSTYNDRSENRARIGNYVHELREPWSVSRRQEKVTTAGIPSEVARAKDFSARQLKRAMETLVASDNDRDAGSSSSASELRALGDWIDSSGPSDVPSAYRTPSGSINATATASLTEANFNAVLQSVYEQGGTSDLVLVGGTSLVKAIANFTRTTGTGSYNTYHVTQDGSSHKMDLKVDLYQGPFNIISIMPTLYNGRTSGGSLTAVSKARGYVLDTNLLSLHYMAKPGSEEQDDNGGGRRGFNSVDFTLRCGNPLGLGKFNATS